MVYLCVYLAANLRLSAFVCSVVSIPVSRFKSKELPCGCARATLRQRRLVHTTAVNLCVYFVGFDQAVFVACRDYFH